MADIFSYIPGVNLLSGGGGHNWPMIAGWTLAIICIVACLWVGFFIIIINKKTIYTIEIDMVSHRIKTFSSRIRKNLKSNVKNLFCIISPGQKQLFRRPIPDPSIT